MPRVGNFGFAADEGENFELEAAQLFESKTLKQRASGRGQVMLHRIAQREETATGALESVAQGNQFLPTVDGDPPTIAQIARELFGVDVEIGDIGIAPDKRVERFDVGGSRSIFFAPVDSDGPGIAELDCDDPQSRVGAEEERI